MEIGYYPGCSMKSTASDYDESLHEVALRLEIKLNEIDDWNCCGSSSAHVINELASHALPARVMALAEDQGMDSVLVPCSSCFVRLAETDVLMKKDPEKAREINKAISPLRYDGTIVIKDILSFLADDVGYRRIARRIEKKFKGLKVLPYYGCLVSRFKGVVENKPADNPRQIEKLLNIMGIETEDWEFKTDCCGAGLSITDTETMINVSQKLIVDALGLNAQALVTACPMCQTNLDSFQSKIKKAAGLKRSIPVFYITDLLGVALGANMRKSHWRKHFIDTKEIVSKAIEVK